MDLEFLISTERTTEMTLTNRPLWISASSNFATSKCQFLANP